MVKGVVDQRVAFGTRSSKVDEKFSFIVTLFKPPVPLALILGCIPLFAVGGVVAAQEIQRRR